MKKFFHYILLATVLLMSASCIEDSRNNYMVPDTLSLVYDEVVTGVSIYAGECNVAILKSGKGQSKATATIGTSNEALTAFNASEEATAQYKMIPASNFFFSEDVVTFDASDLKKDITMTWNPDLLCKLVNSDTQVLPVSILNGSLDINQSRNLLALNFLKSTVGFATTGSTVLAKEDKNENGEVQVKIKVDRTIPKDVEVTYAIDNSLIAAYNAEKGTEYEQAPDGYVVLPSAPAKIAAGTFDVYSTITLNTQKIFGTDGKILNFRTLIVPLKVTASSLNGVLLSDQVYYLLINNPLAGATVSRIWGKYSIDKLWTQGYADIPDGGDRNLALDGQWVYVPYAVGGSTAKITAISVDDPATTKQVNFTGATANTITSACVRVIDKGNGAPMLIGSGANASEFAFYAWENGIDSAPTKFGLKCSWRRHGDRIEYKGTWTDGQLWAHSYQGTFASYYEFKNGQFVELDPKYGHLLVDLPYAGFGGPYWYPGSDEMLFASSDWGAYFSLKGTTRTADVFTVKETVREDYGDATLTFGYHVFTYRGDTYIAYTAYDNDLVNSQGNPYPSKQRARLIVLEGQGSWRKSLDESTRKVVFEAPLQGENFEDIAVAASSSAQGDCAVYVQPDKVLIAAGAQGIGISLFKLE